MIRDFEISIYIGITLMLIFWIIALILIKFRENVESKKLSRLIYIKSLIFFFGAYLLNYLIFKFFLIIDSFD